jgi:hypothetical protein
VYFALKPAVVRLTDGPFVGTLGYRLGDHDMKTRWIGLATAIAGAFCGLASANATIIPAFTESSNLFVSQPITFDGSSSTDTSGDAIVVWSWDFGDGNPATHLTTSPTFIHSYDRTGVYGVTLRVGSASGLFASTEEVITITAAAVPGPTVGAGASSFALAALFLGWFMRRRTHQQV